MLSNRQWLTFLIPAILIAVSLGFLNSPWSSETLSVHIGKPYTEVIKDSTFSVNSNTTVYPGDPKDEKDPPYPASTWIRTPTIIEFDDPAYGFTLPETVFGVVTYKDLKVVTITTSPMSKTADFTATILRLTEVQKTLQERGWKRQTKDKNDWFKLESAKEQEQLQEKLFDQASSISLYAPGKYSLFLSIQCFEHCSERNTKTARYLIDISIGRDRT